MHKKKNVSGIGSKPQGLIQHFVNDLINYESKYFVTSLSWIVDLKVHCLVRGALLSEVYIHQHAPTDFHKPNQSGCVTFPPQYWL